MKVIEILHDLNFILTGNNEGEIVIWKMPNMIQHTNIGNNNIAITSFCYLNDGVSFYCGDANGRLSKLLINDLAAKTNFDKKLNGPLEGLTTGYDSTYIYSFCNTNVNVWNILTNSHVFDIEAHTEKISNILYLREQRMLVSVGTDKLLHFWDPIAPSKERLKKSFKDHTSAILHLDYCGIGGKQALFSISDNREICFWSIDSDLNKITFLKKNILEDIPINVVYCQNNKHLILVVEQGFYVYEYESLSVSDLFQAEENEISICKYFGDGSTLLCYSKNNNIDFWECD